jgi:hypothetical protein
MGMLVTFVKNKQVEIMDEIKKHPTLEMIALRNFSSFWARFIVLLCFLLLEKG